MTGGHVLVSRMDNAGDVVLAGPAVRAVASAASRVTFLAGPGGAEAAALLPGVDDVWVFDAPWSGFAPPVVERDAIDALVDRVADAGIDTAIVLTSFHQSPLPLALLLRLAGVETIAATSVDYPGSLLDVRHPYRDELHEVEQSLALCAEAGFASPDMDSGRLSLQLSAPTIELPDEPYVVIHPGASVPARGLPLGPTRRAAAALAQQGHTVVVTGSAGERGLTAAVADAVPAGRGLDLGGRTHLADLAHLIDGADAVVCGNTGPAHLAAAVGTPVVVAYAPVVPAHRWRPWGVPHVLLGLQGIACAGCRARTCPLPGQPCLAPYDAAAVVEAVHRLLSPSSRRVTPRCAEPALAGREVSP
jgi:ADP-heptose:LPS heptosyltransferase